MMLLLGLFFIFLWFLVTITGVGDYTYDSPFKWNFHPLEDELEKSLNRFGFLYKGSYGGIPRYKNSKGIQIELYKGEKKLSVKHPFRKKMWLDYNTFVFHAENIINRKNLESVTKHDPQPFIPKDNLNKEIFNRLKMEGYDKLMFCDGKVWLWRNSNIYSLMEIWGIDGEFKAKPTTRSDFYLTEYKDTEDFFEQFNSLDLKYTHPSIKSIQSMRDITDDILKNLDKI